MDKNTWNSIIGFTLIFIIIFVWAKLNSPNDSEIAQQAAKQDSLEQVNQAKEIIAESPAPAELPETIPSDLDSTLLGRS